MIVATCRRCTKRFHLLANDVKICSKCLAVLEGQEEQRPKKARRSKP